MASGSPTVASGPFQLSLPLAKTSIDLLVKRSLHGTGWIDGGDDWKIDSPKTQESNYSRICLIRHLKGIRKN